MEDKAIFLKIGDFHSEHHCNTGNFAKLYNFNLSFISSFMEELPSPTLKIFINITSKHIETTVHEKCNFLKNITSLQWTQNFTVSHA